VESEIVALHGYNTQLCNSDIFVHQNLLCERFSYLKTLIENDTVRKDGHRVVNLPNLDHLACKMLAQWLYGQPLRENDNYADEDLTYLAELYDLACDAEEENGDQINGLVEACVDAAEQCLVQKTKTLSDPIKNLEHILVKDDQFSGNAVILRQLVYGESTTDGRTKKWLEDYFAREHEDGEEIGQLICMEFAKKTCDQNQHVSSTDSASTAN
jgi:hypothetical protein